MKIYLFLAVHFLACISSALGSEQEVYRDQNVVVTEKTSPLYPIMGLHTGKRVCLKIAGTKYCGIRGSKPYYLDIPQIHSVLFVTEGGAYKVTIHVVDLETKKSIEIDGEGTGFGWQIGGVQAVDSDRIEKADTKTMVLITHGGDWKEVITLDLLRRRIERVQTFDYDPKTRIAGHERK